MLNNPLALLTRPEAAHDVIDCLTSYSGRFFEPLAALSYPNRFEASDVVAVSCLSVTVPPETAGWLLVGDGAAATERLLCEIDVDRSQMLVGHDLEANRAAIALWRFLVGRRDVGPTVASKLLAAKRPHLVPIDDSYDADYLSPEQHRRQWHWWGLWRDLPTGDAKPDLDDALRQLRTDVAKSRADDPPTPELSDLRLLDIVIWMYVHRRRQSR
jgi:hypothetical protein